MALLAATLSLSIEECKRKLPTKPVKFAGLFVAGSGSTFNTTDPEETLFLTTCPNGSLKKSSNTLNGSRVLFLLMTMSKIIFIGEMVIFPALEGKTSTFLISATLYCTFFTVSVYTFGRWGMGYSSTQAPTASGSFSISFPEMLVRKYNLYRNVTSSLI